MLVRWSCLLYGSKFQGNMFIYFPYRTNKSVTETARSKKCLLHFSGTAEKKTFKNILKPKNTKKSSPNFSVTSKHLNIPRQHKKLGHSGLGKVSLMHGRYVAPGWSISRSVICLADVSQEILPHVCFFSEQVGPHQQFSTTTGLESRSGVYLANGLAWHYKSVETFVWPSQDSQKILWKVLLVVLTDVHFFFWWHLFNTSWVIVHQFFIKVCWRW